MPIKTQIDHETGFRTHAVTGRLTLDEVLSTLENAYANPDFRADAPAVWDLTGAIGDFPTEDVRHLADFVSKRVGDEITGKVALVVSRDFEFGMARMYESILGSQSSKPVMVFRDMEEAKAWLNKQD
jgi:hypothetical protein